MYSLVADPVILTDLRQVLVSFHSASGLAAEISDQDGRVLITSSQSNIADLFLSMLPPDWQIEKQQEDTHRFPENDTSINHSQLFRGLFKLTGTIHLVDQNLARLSFGPFFDTQSNTYNFRQLVKESISDPTTILDAIQEVPILSGSQAESFFVLLIQIIKQVTEKGLEQQRLVETNADLQKQLHIQRESYQNLEKCIQERTTELERANAALQESEQRFRVALIDTPLVVFNQDLNLRYTWIYNPHNYANQPVVGKTDVDLFAPDDAIRLTALKRRVIGAGLLTREEVSVRVGEHISHFDMTLNPLYDANGSVTGLTCAATVITERKQIEEDMRKRLAESEGIQKIAKGLLQKIGLDEVLEIVCNEAMHLTAAKGSAVLMLDKEGWLRLTHRVGLPVYTLDKLPVNGTLAGQAVQTGNLVWVNRQNSQPEEPMDQWQGYPWTPGLLSMLSVPLKVDTQTIGVLNLLDKPGELTREDIRIIDLFADQAAIIIEHVRLQQQSEQIAVLEERQRLARELHDSVTQALYSVNLYADAGILAYSRKQWIALEKNLQEVRSMAREAMYDMRLLVFELRPLLLEQEGLVAALRFRLAAVEDRSGLKTEIHIEAERQLPVGIEEQIYRIATEGLNNVVKHARASVINLKLKYSRDSLRLEIVDDGLGFDLANTKQRGGVGLQSIRERVEHLQGSLEIESNPSVGTRILVTIPLNSRDINDQVLSSRR